MADRKKDHGYVLERIHTSYADLQKPGTVTIRENQEKHRVEIEVADFRWGDKGTCRQQVTKAMCWARDILDAQIRAHNLVPGGHLVAIEGSGPPEEVCTNCDWEGKTAELLKGDACPKCKVAV